MTRPLGRLTTGALALALASAALAGVAPAHADDPAPAKGAQDSGSVKPASKCTLRPSAHASTKNEWTSCLSVSTSLDRLPSVGQTARLTVVVTASDTLPAADVSIELPAGLSWVSTPTGLSNGSAKASARPEDRGVLSTASARRALSAGQRVTYVGVVKATATGSAQIRARATAAYGGGVQAGSDDVTLTIARTGGVSAKGHQKSGSVGAVARVPAGARVSAAPQSAKKAASAPIAGAAAAGPSAPCDTRVAGSWTYQDQTGAWRPSRNVQVQVWDDDFFGDSLLTTGVTDWNGNYNLCFDSQVEGWPDAGTADVYVKFITENSIWKVQNGGALTWQTGTTNDVATGSTLNLGSLTTGDPALHRGLHAFDEANDAWAWIPKPTNSCFDQDDASCRQLRINWAPDSTDGTYYSLGGNDIHLAADDPNAQMTVVHEIAHAIMDDVYNDAFPAAPSCNPHSIQGASSQGCAWTEGFAEWFPATVYNDPYFRWPSGASLNLELPTWNYGWSDGDATEGRVAGALIDLTDATNEIPWDRKSEGYAPTWNTFMTYVSGTLNQFMAHRSLKGYPNGSNELATLFINTVDYGFRDPLANNTQYPRPMPYVPHNFSFNTTTGYWSVVALKPTGTADVDLRLYDDYAQTANLRTSSYGGQEVDFVAIDSNRRALGDYYPRGYLYSGTGGYRIQLGQGSVVVPAGRSTAGMSLSSLVVVRDIYLTAGVRQTITVTTGSATQDPQLFLMGSTSGVSSTYIRGRGDAVASSTAAGPGVAETISYTPTASGWYGLVLVNKAGNGTYTITNTAAAKTAPAPIHP